MMGVASVKVRMYRGLLGDCFLVTVEGKQDRPSFILIDCGILQNVEGDKERMKAIAANIRETTGGFVDLLIITHEHFDHISGFAHAREILLDPDQMKFGEVWMGWTEDPFDAKAKELRATFGKRKLAMTSVATALAARGQDELLDDLTLDLQNFIGPIEPATSGLSAAPEGRLTGARIMEELKKGAGKAVFHSPGKVTASPGNAPLTAAILAPPRADSRLFKDLPSKGEGKETYLGEQYLEYSLLGLDESGEGAQIDRNSPFAPRFSEGLSSDPANRKGWSREQRTVGRWLHDHYYAPHDSERRPQDYRTIDDVWAGSASSLALKLDSDTNNTSLVVAFRLPDGKFLLFAADAQVGNWLSWHDQTYDFGDETLSAGDILGRTVLYKVGHHCSHNATLKAKGLELMVDKGLTAMIPTVEEIARQQGKPPGWKMPFEEILKELLVRCNGRVLRGDRLWTEDEDTAGYRPNSEFEEWLDETNDLFVELRVYPTSRTRKRGEGR